MENEKRPLKLYEKVMTGFAILLIFCAIPMFILAFCGVIDYAASIAWMCLSLANVLHNCLRWETHTKVNIVFICVWSILFVLQTGLLILRLVL